MDLFGQIDRWHRDSPDRVAFVGTGQLSYGELHEAAGRLATYLDGLAGDPGLPVAVIGHKEPELIVAFVAAALAGRPYVPIDSGLPPARVARITELAGVAQTLTPALVRKTLDEPGHGGALRRWSVRHDDARPLYVMYTSGSTGEPKGVVVTHGNVRHFLAWMLDEHAPTPDDVFLNVVPYSFDVSVMDTWVALATGSSIVAVTHEHRGQPARLRERLQTSGATIWVSTPSFARLCLADPMFTQALMPRLKTFLFCGETLSPRIAADLLDRFPDAAVWNTYGPTEATVATTSIRVDRDLLGRYPMLPIGRPMPGSRVVVVDDALRVRPEDDQGEILIAGLNVSPGYLGRPDLTARAFCTFAGLPAYRTGDLGRSRDGLLFFEGRADDQIKLNGYRIELGDVEVNIRRLADVLDAAVVLRERGARGDSLAAFVVMRPDPAADPTARELALRAALARALPTYMLPQIVRFVEALPLTTNGKVDRRALLDTLP